MLSSSRGSASRYLRAYVFRHKQFEFAVFVVPLVLSINSKEEHFTVNTSVTTLSRPMQNIRALTHQDKDSEKSFLLASIATDHVIFCVDSWRSHRGEKLSFSTKALKAF